MGRTILIIFFIFLGTLCAFAVDQKDSVDALKQRCEQASTADQARWCVHVAQTQLQHMDAYYKAGDNDNARRALQDVETYGVRAANASSESGKHQKDTEIALRKLSARLGEIVRDVDFDERAPIKAAINKIDKAHDDLLSRMFQKR
jgi:hypothetical protein